MLNDPLSLAPEKGAGGAKSPFDTEDPAAFDSWRGLKLAQGPDDDPLPVVELQVPGRLTAAERGAIISSCKQFNMALYAFPGSADGPRILSLGRQLGLERLDCAVAAADEGVATLRVGEDRGVEEYIPYTDRALNWHTDGYYNPPDRPVRGVIMHCVARAASGGSNSLADPELVYLRLREQNVDYIKALMHPRAMTIPANESGGSATRPARTGPVFSVDPLDGNLHMRYTARTRSIQWRDDPLTREAVDALRALLEGSPPWVFTVHLEPGQGIVCNNVLHNREGFRNGGRDTGEQRVVLRARYHDRVAVG